MNETGCGEPRVELSVELPFAISTTRNTVGITSVSGEVEASFAATGEGSTLARIQLASPDRPESVDWARFCNAQLPILNQAIQRYRLATHDTAARLVTPSDIRAWRVKRDGVDRTLVVCPVDVVTDEASGDVAIVAGVPGELDLLDGLSALRAGDTRTANRCAEKAFAAITQWAVCQQRQRLGAGESDTPQHRSTHGWLAELQFLSGRSLDTDQQAEIDRLRSWHGKAGYERGPCSTAQEVSLAVTSARWYGIFARVITLGLLDEGEGRPAEIADRAETYIAGASPDNESDRLESLRSYRLFDEPADESFSLLCSLAASACRASAAVLNLVDASLQRPWAFFGEPGDEIPRCESLCGEVVAAGQPVVVPALHDDPRYAGHPFVRRRPEVKAYAGVPLSGRDGLPIGALCVLDNRPRTFSDTDVSTLRGIARQVMALLELRRADIRGGVIGDRLHPSARDPERLRAALDHGEFVAYYQPIVALGTSELLGLEALLRWEHPEAGVLSPAAFLPAVESSSLMKPIGRAIRDQACATLARLRGSGHVGPQVRMALNVAPIELATPGLACSIERAVERHGLSGADLVVELVESSELPDLALVRAELETLRDGGTLSVLDDYGSGWSNLTRLLALPVDGLKIDRQLTMNVVSDPRAAALMRAVLGLTTELGLEAIAEGIETEVVRDFVLAAGATAGQGWFFAPALSPDGLPPALRAGFRPGVDLPVKAVRQST